MFQASENVGPIQVNPFSLYRIIQAMYEYASAPTQSVNSREKIEADFKTMSVNFTSWYDFSRFVNEHPELGNPHKMELTVRSSHDQPVSYVSLTIKDDFNHLYVNGNDAHAVAVAFRQMKAEIQKNRPWYGRFRTLTIMLSHVLTVLAWVLSCFLFAILSSVFSFNSVVYQTYVGVSLIVAVFIFARNLINNPWFPYSKISLIGFDITK